MDERGADHLAQLLRRDLLARGIDRGRSRLFATTPFRSNERTSKPYLAGPSAQPDVLAGLELPREPRLVEPRRGDRPAAVRDPRGEDLEPAATPFRDRENLAGDGHVLVAEKVGDTPLGSRRLVPARAGSAGDRPGCVGRAWRAASGRPARRRRARPPGARAPRDSGPLAGGASRKAGPRLRSRLEARLQSRNRSG